MGYIGHTSTNEQGPSVPTGYRLNPSPLPVDLARLKQGEDTNYAIAPGQFPLFRKALQNVRMCLNREYQPTGSYVDEWLSLANGERFTQTSLGFIVDMFPMIMEKTSQLGPMWYPTVSLNLDVKKPIGPEGLEWVFVRVEAKEVRNGRMDLGVTVLDEEGDILALAKHVTLVRFSRFRWFLVIFPF